MNCRDFELNVLALARNELIDATKRDPKLELSLAHAENCMRCADRLAGERVLTTCVHGVIAELAEEKAPGHVRAALLTAFREQAPVVNPTSTVVPMPPRDSRHWRLEAIAAGVLMLVSVFAAVWFYSHSATEKQAAQTLPTGPVITPELAGPNVNPEPEVTDPPTTKRPSRAGHRGAKRNTRATEEVTEFFPLMDGIDLDSLEAFQAVRVELPASALMDLGLRGGPDTPAGPVTADVLLGHDGQAWAIRFVR